MQESFINNRIFRIFTPVLYGVIVYILILLIFDSINQLAQNFFSFEVILCIIITYSIFELMRLVTTVSEKRLVNIQRLSLRITMQLSANAIAVFFLTSTIIVLYYRFLVGFAEFRTELIVFNTIYIFTCIFYNTLYFSIFLLNRTNEAKIAHEIILKQSLINELEEYKSKINPDLLYSSLETAISLVRKDATKASEFIQNLSDVYRHIVSSKRNEPIPISKEFEVSDKLVTILNAKHHNAIELVVEKGIMTSSKKIIPGTLHIIIEELIHENLVSDLQPLVLECSINEDNLVIESRTVKRLSKIDSEFDEYENLKKAYLSFSENTIALTENGVLTTVTIPLL